MPPCWRFLTLLWLGTSLGACASAGGASTAPVVGAGERNQTAAPPPAIEFDRKGVDFDSWLSDLTARLRKNWNIPMAAMNSKGHVVVAFNIHKNGAITDLRVLRPSSIVAFNNSAFNAVSSSNPVAPLPSA